MIIAAWCIMLSYQAIKLNIMFFIFVKCPFVIHHITENDLLYEAEHTGIVLLVIAYKYMKKLFC